jgi:hypothetical protein
MTADKQAEPCDCHRVLHNCDAREGCRIRARLEQPVAEATPRTDMSEAEELLREARDMLNSAHVSTDLVWPRSDLILKIDAYLARPADGVVVPTLAEIRGAVARGWCHKVNERKTMDSDLALAIADEVNAMLSAAPSDRKGGGE